MNKSKSKPIYETLILQHFSYSNGRSRTHKCKSQSLVTLPFRLRWNVNLLLIHGDRYRCPSPTYIGLLCLFSRSGLTPLCCVRNSQKIFPPLGLEPKTPEPESGVNTTFTTEEWMNDCLFEPFYSTFTISLLARPRCPTVRVIRIYSVHFQS